MTKKKKTEEKKEGARASSYVIALLFTGGFYWLMNSMWHLFGINRWWLYGITGFVFFVFVGKAEEVANQQEFYANNK